MAKKYNNASHIGKEGNKSFNNMLLNYEDRKEAEEARKRKSQNALDRQHGMEIEMLIYDLEQDEKLLAEIKQERAKVKKELSQTRPRINTAAKFKDNPGDKPIPFGEWILRHRIVFVLLLVLIFLVTGAGGISVYANLIGSGNPAFISMPWAAALMAIIPTVGMVSSKCFYYLLYTQRAQFLYAGIIYLLAFISLGYWVYLFSEQFTGLGAGFDLDAISGAGKQSGLFVRVQIAAELLCGASLFIMLDNISDLYSGDWSMPNEQHRNLKKQFDELSKAKAALEKSVPAKRGHIRVLLATYDDTIAEDMAAFISLRSRYQ